MASGVGAEVIGATEAKLQRFYGSEAGIAGQGEAAAQGQRRGLGALI